MEQGGMADPRQRLPPPKPSAGCTRGHGPDDVRAPGHGAACASSETPHGSSRARAKPRRLEKAARQGAGRGAVFFYRVNRIWHVEAARKWGGSLWAARMPHGLSGRRRA